MLGVDICLGPDALGGWCRDFLSEGSAVAGITIQSIQWLTLHGGSSSRGELSFSLDEEGSFIVSSRTF